MERRREVRVRLNQTVRVTALGANHQLEGKATDQSGRGMRILIPGAIPVGSPVRIDLEDVLLLAEVCYCQPFENGFMIGITIDQVLSGLAALTRLNQALLQQNSEREPDRAALSYSMSE